MLGKLLKYDLKYIYKVLGIYYAIVIAGVLIFLATDFENPSGIVEFIHLFVGGASFGLSIGLFVNAITRSWVRFQKNFYGDEAYLTHTLPVTKRELLLSKTIASFVTLVASLMVLVFCTIAVQIGFSELGNINEVLKSQGSSLLSIGILLFVTLVLQQTFIILCGFAGILIGHRKNEHRGAWSWLAGGGIYLITSLLIVGITLIWSLFDPSIHDFIFSGKSQDLFSLANISKVVIGIDIMYFFASIATYAIAQKTFDHGVDVE